MRAVRDSVSAQARTGSPAPLPSFVNSDASSPRETRFLVHSPVQAVVSQGTIVALHALLSDGLMPDPVMCGRIRRRAVEIGGSVYLPVALPQRLEELLGIVVGMAAEIEDPFWSWWLGEMSDLVEKSHSSQIASSIPFSLFPIPYSISISNMHFVGFAWPYFCTVRAWPSRTRWMDEWNQGRRLALET